MPTRATIDAVLRLAWVLLFVLAIACDAGVATQVLVHVDAEEGALEGASAVRVRVLSAGGADTQTERLADRGTFPFTQPLHPGAESSGSFDIIVEVLDAAGAIIGRQRAVGAFAEGERRDVYVRFDATCRVTTPGEAPDCGEDGRCIAGVCEPVCVQSDAEPVGGVTPPMVCDVTAPRGVCGRGGDVEGSVVLSNIRLEWVTPNQAEIRWDTENREALFGFEVEIAATEEDLLAGRDVRVVDQSENPELARAELLCTGAQGDEINLINTVIRGLEPNTRYRVRLVAEDDAGDFSCTEAVGVQTNPAPLFGPASLGATGPSAGTYTIPMCIPFVDEASRAPEDASGTTAGFWEYINRCEDDGDGSATGVSVPTATGGMCGAPMVPAPNCPENLRVYSLETDTSTLSEADFSSAYLELSIAIESSQCGWSSLGVRGEKDGDSRDYKLERIALIADGEYHRYQVPLSVMHGHGMTTPDGPLPYGGIDEITGFWIGSTFSDNAIVRIDDVAIYWGD